MDDLKYHQTPERKEHLAAMVKKRRLKLEFLKWQNSLSLKDRARILYKKKFREGFGYMSDSQTLNDYFMKNIWPGIQLQEKLDKRYEKDG